MKKTTTRALKQLILTLVLLNASLFFGQIALPSAVPVIENFNGTVISSTVNLPANWKMSNEGTGAPTWANAGNFTASSSSATSGTPSSGGRYNWGNSTITTDRAIGFMTSGSYASPNSVMAFYSNTSGLQINDLTISFDYERYRINSSACSVTFFTSTDGSTWTARTAGDSGAFATSSSAYDFSTGTVISKSVNLTGVNIANGGSIYIRWNFDTVGANSQGVGLDNVSLTASLAASAITSAQTGNWSSTST